MVEPTGEKTGLSRQEVLKIGLLAAVSAVLTACLPKKGEEQPIISTPSQPEAKKSDLPQWTGIVNQGDSYINTVLRITEVDNINAFTDLGIILAHNIPEDQKSIELIVHTDLSGLIHADIIPGFPEAWPNDVVMCGKVGNIKEYVKGKSLTPNTQFMQIEGGQKSDGGVTTNYLNVNGGKYDAPITFQSVSQDGYIGPWEVAVNNKIFSLGVFTQAFNQAGTSSIALQQLQGP